MQPLLAEPLLRVVGSSTSTRAVPTSTRRLPIADMQHWSRTERLAPRLALLHDILAYEVVGHWSTSVPKILEKPWIRKRAEEIEWAPTAAGLGSIKKKLARLLCDEEGDEERAGGLLDKVEDAWEDAMRADMMQEAALDARAGNRVVYATEAGITVTAKIAGVETTSDGNEKFTLALPDGTSMRVSRSDIAPSPSQCATPRPSRNATPNPSPAGSRNTSSSPTKGGTRLHGETGLSSRFAFNTAVTSPSPSPGGMRSGHWSSPGSARGPEPRQTSLSGRRNGSTRESNLTASPRNEPSSLSSAISLDRQLCGSHRSSNAYRRSPPSSPPSSAIADISDDAASVSSSSAFPSRWQPSSTSGVKAYLQSYPKKPATSKQSHASPVSPASPPTASALAGKVDRRSRLQELVGLRDDGIISEDLFHSKQREILNEI